MDGHTAAAFAEAAAATAGGISSDSGGLEISSAEPIKSLVIRHTADPRVVLPVRFSSLTGLVALSLAGDITSQEGLSPVAELTQLTRLVLGPGNIDMGIVGGLGSGLLGGLQELVLCQMGPWDVPQLASVLAMATKLQQLTVEELEPKR
jgi:hypothetical protein